ncbi:MAG: putative lipoprotein YmbA [Pseudohongiellaceae bacterium]|jgi:uncharacterized lipoprotein YmbA
MLRWLSLCCCLAASSFVVGCASAPTHFYVLTPLQSAASVDGVNGLALGIDPVNLPGLLDRPLLVTRIDEHERRLEEFARWAEPLDENIRRVLSENLSALLGSEQIVSLPTVRAVQLDRRLQVDVLRFEGTPGGEVVLEVRWSLYDPKTNTRQFTRHGTYAAAIGGDGMGPLVSAMSGVLGQLSHTVAAELSKTSYRQLW